MLSFLTRKPPASAVFAKPVFIIGCPRSGTTLLFETLVGAPDVWTIRAESHRVIEGISMLHPSRRGWESNRLTAADADPKTIRRLIKRFRARIVNRSGDRPPARAVGLRLVEKTPKNCLRVPFLAAAFPDAHFVYLYRDAQETISSIIDVWRSSRFVSYRHLPGWPAPGWKLLLIPGWRELMGKDAAELAARQWAAATSTLLDDLAAVPPDRRFVASYDRLIAAPQTEVERLCSLLGLAWDKPLTGTLPTSRTTLTPPRLDKWRHNAADLDRVMPALAATVTRARAVAAELRAG